MFKKYYLNIAGFVVIINICTHKLYIFHTFYLIEGVDALHR